MNYPLYTPYVPEHVPHSTLKRLGDEAHRARNSSQRYVRVDTEVLLALLTRVEVLEAKTAMLKSRLLGATASRRAAA